MLILLDTGVLGTLCNPNISLEVFECRNWLYQLLSKGAYVVTSEICDYEVRRGLILARKSGKSSNGLEILDNLRELIDFLPITREVFQVAAEIWADVRYQNQPTSALKNIDADMIISAHWQLLTQEFPGRYVVVSTTNVKHLQLFTEAKEWRNIRY